MKRISLLALSFSITACGASDPATTTPSTTEPPQAAAAAEPQHDEHGDMPAQLVAFHDVLKPLWHDETANRQANTCGQIAELDARAGALTQVEVAPDKKEAWAAGVTQLDAAIEELGAGCTGKGDFVASFTKVHDGFHALLELATGHHEEHGEGHGEGHGGAVK
jgi:hypothetical protein